jgi:rhamnosyltransferase subunit B
MRFLMHPIGSHGDVLPFIGLGKALQARGHEVHMYVHAPFANQVREAGLAFTSLGEMEDFDRVVRDPKLVHSRKIHHVLAEAVLESVPLAYQAMRDDLKFSSTVTIGTSLSFACRLLQEKHAIRTVTVHFSPVVFRSNIQPSRMSEFKVDAPAFMRPFLWSLIDRWMADPLYAQGFNKYRAELGLSPVKNLFRDWIHGADIVIGMFPEWFAQKQADWPAHASLTDFPLYDHGDGAALPDEVKAFLDAGEAPIGFTPGTFTATASKFFKVSIEACRRLGRRGILLTRFADQLPAPLPKGFAHFDYVPFSALLPKLAAFVHHGGIGTTSQTMQAGVPQLIRPVVVDQFDTSSRTVALGVARELLPWSYRPQAVATALAALIDDADVRRSCAEVAGRLKNCDGIELTCDRILDELGRLPGRS